MNKDVIELKLRILEEVLKTYKNILQLTKDIYGVDIRRAESLDGIGNRNIQQIRQEIWRDTDGQDKDGRQTESGNGSPDRNNG